MKTNIKHHISSTSALALYVTLALCPPCGDHLPSLPNEARRETGELQEPGQFLDRVRAGVPGVEHTHAALVTFSQHFLPFVLDHEG